MTGTFVAIDVETANASRASICEIGLTAIVRNQVDWQWSSLVNPHEDFEKLNCDIHNIAPASVVGAPSFEVILEGIANSIDDQFVVSWSEFDQDALHQACQKYAITPPSCRWVDACSVARVVWPQLENHKLATVTSELGITFDHHNAAADAWACASSLIRALEQTSTTIEYWYERFGLRTPRNYEGPAKVAYPVAVSYDGNPEGPLFGHSIVFTGEFAKGKSRLGAAASFLGCSVRQSISKKTTIVVYGPGPNGKTQKLMEAEQLLAGGHNLVLLDEGQFVSLAAERGANC